MNISADNRWFVPALIALAGLAIAVLIALYFWQTETRDSRLAEAGAGAATVLHLQDAATDSAVGGELLSAYASQGDPALVHQVRGRYEGAVESLTAAASTSGSETVADIASRGAALAASSERIIALRQSGREEAAAASIDDLEFTLESFGLALDAAIGAELETAASLQTDAENADTAARWLLITALSVAVSMAGGVVYVVMQALADRRKTLEPVEPAGDGA